MLINISNGIVILLFSSFIFLSLFSTEDETGKENNDPDIDIGEVDMTRGEKAVCVKI